MSLPKRPAEDSQLNEEEGDWHSSHFCLFLEGVLVTIGSLTRNIQLRSAQCFNFLAEVSLELWYLVSEGC